MEHAAWDRGSAKAPVDEVAHRPQSTPAGPRRPLVHALAALGTAIALAVGLDIVIGRIAPHLSRSGQSALVSAELLLEGLMTGFCVWFFLRQTGWRSIDLGLRRPRNGRKDAVLACIVTWVISIFAAGAYSYVAFPQQHDKQTTTFSCTDGAKPSPDGTCGVGPQKVPAAKTVEIISAPKPPQHELVKALSKDELPFIVRVAIFLAACAIAPLVEEMLFRGFLYRALTRHVGQIGAVLGSSVAFALVHASAVPLKATVVQGILGVGLCLLYRQQASLWPCVFVHAFQNAIGTSLASSIRWWTLLVVAVTFAWVSLWAWSFRRNLPYTDPVLAGVGDVPAVEVALVGA
jgi:membrane protease YdiL (CAAX protease family)